MVEPKPQKAQHPNAQETVVRRDQKIVLLMMMVASKRVRKGHLRAPKPTRERNYSPERDGPQLIRIVKEELRKWRLFSHRGGIQTL